MPDPHRGAGSRGRRRPRGGFPTSMRALHGLARQGRAGGTRRRAPWSAVGAGAYAVPFGLTLQKHAPDTDEKVFLAAGSDVFPTAVEKRPARFSINFGRRSLPAQLPGREADHRRGRGGGRRPTIRRWRMRCSSDPAVGRRPSAGDLGGKRLPTNSAIRILSIISDSVRCLSVVPAVGCLVGSAAGRVSVLVVRLDRVCGRDRAHGKATSRAVTSSSRRFRPGGDNVLSPVVSGITSSPPTSRAFLVGECGVPFAEVGRRDQIRSAPAFRVRSGSPRGPGGFSLSGSLSFICDPAAAAGRPTSMDPVLHPAVVLLLMVTMPGRYVAWSDLMVASRGCRAVSADGW